MKIIQHTLITLLFIALAFPPLAYSQDDLTYDLKYEVNRTYPTITISREQLKEAHTLIDLSKYYQASWVKEYLSVEILTSYKGSIKKTVGKNNILSQEQKDIMDMADVGTDISVKVQYIPDNTLKHNDGKEMKFSFVVDPESEATYYGGEQQLKKYLKEHGLEKISPADIKRYQLAAVKFTINEEGQVINAHVFESSKDERVDKLLLEAISKMPGWKPAEYANGTKVKQEFVLLVGDMESCVINLVNIR